MPQCSAIFPSSMRKKPTERHTACLPLGGNATNWPVCVPSPWTSVAT